MGLNDIQLTPFLLVDLYSDVLIDSNATDMPKPESTASMGKNAKKILFVVTHKDIELLTEGHLNFLKNILTPCKLTIDDISIINWENSNKEFQKILNEFKSKIILLFDVSPDNLGLPLNFPKFQIQEFDKRVYLFVPSLEELEKNIETKKAFWNALKKLFKL